jgi:PTH1 family peptidyl-tRNA hydrolase
MVGKQPDKVDEGAVLLVGLGNPGPQYAQTRHNIGFLLVDHVASRSGFALDREKFKGLTGQGLWGGRKLIALKPQTFMNLSGQSVSPAVKFFQLSPGAVVAVHDDVDLPFGAVRLKRGGGAGGHNGLRSMDKELGSQDYFRLRMGVGRPERGEVSGHVLGRFDDLQWAQLGDWLDQGAGALEVLLREGLREAQNRFHGEPGKRS